MDEWNFDDFNYDDPMDGKWNRQHQLEIILKTFDGAQHLRLHGWLKSNDTLIKMESFANKGEDYFGSFIVLLESKVLDNLKEANMEKELFTHIDIISNEERTFKISDNMIKLDEGIKDFLFDIAGQISSPEDITKFVGKANETTLKLFRQSESYITEYIETNDMTYDNKMKDLDLLIQYFEEQERYEDCALLVEVKNKVKKREIKLKIQGNE
jgi:hypothetical protein